MNKLLAIVFLSALTQLFNPLFAMEKEASHIQESEVEEITEDEESACSICFSSFDQDKHLKISLPCCEEKQAVCSVCLNKIIETEQTARQHWNEQQTEMVPGKPQCPYCRHKYTKKELRVLINIAKQHKKNLISVSPLLSMSCR